MMPVRISWVIAASRQSGPESGCPNAARSLDPSDYPKATPLPSRSPPGRRSNRFEPPRHWPRSWVESRAANLHHGFAPVGRAFAVSSISHDIRRFGRPRRQPPQRRPPSHRRINPSGQPNQDRRGSRDRSSPLRPCRSRRGEEEPSTSRTADATRRVSTGRGLRLDSARRDDQHCECRRRHASSRSTTPRSS